MSNTVQSQTARKSTYKRPYKTRHQRRERDRRKHDESKDHKFLLRVVVVVGILIAVAVVFAMKGMNEVSELTNTLSE